MIVLTVNAGSSSVRLAAFACDGSQLVSIGSERHETGTHQPVELLTAFVAQHVSERPQRVAHRVVHGGRLLTVTRWLDAGVEAEIERLLPMPPPMARRSAARGASATPAAPSTSG